MKILIVGSGAREHAIGTSIGKNSSVEKIYFAPGNGGTREIGENINIGQNDLQDLLRFAETMDIDYTIVGPEEPLVNGIVDLFEEAGQLIFGPSRAAAKLEGSKAYAKSFCEKYNIPTARYIESDREEVIRQKAYNMLEEGKNAVLKADGLAGGKGVVLASTKSEVEHFLQDVFTEDKFNGQDVVVEDFLEGFETSLIAFTDGKSIAPLATVKDHKTFFEGGRGPNTGGMGTYSPNLETEPLMDEIHEVILEPFLKGLQEEGLDYRGIVFIGLMIGNDGPQVLEFNVRFGDPETQSILNRLDSDLLTLMEATTAGKLDPSAIKNNDKKVVSLVLAAGGYPEAPEKGKAISGLADIEDVTIYHAGTKLEGETLLTNGGRVLTVTASGDSFEEAMEKAYRGAESIHFDHKQYRRDIGPKVHRAYVKRRDGFNEREKSLLKKMASELDLDLNELEIYIRYDLENITNEEMDILAQNVLHEAPNDEVFLHEEAIALQSNFEHPIVVEYLPGQFVQRDKALEDTATVLFNRSDILGKSATLYNFKGDLSPVEMGRIQEYLINPVDQVEGEVFGIPTTLRTEEERTYVNEVLEGFITWDRERLKEEFERLDLAMNFDDFSFIQEYFIEKGRDINETELAILDTYWSDHCRHTTFLTELTISFEEEVDALVREAFEDYVKTREELKRKKTISLMDLGTIVAKYLKEKGIKTKVEESDEVNACSIHMDLIAEDPHTGEEETIPYLLMFKNETHNHPTEIEPFGGASTCLGGCIRDPLSGRAYVYQAMRVTGAGNPLTPLHETLKGKLPQSKITKEAADGYSSYGNQIGLPAGLIHEIYHPDYVAKRMEIGAVVGAVREEDIIREEPTPGDLILLLGGKTGRDGIGGATGSSKEHNTASLETASAEVQKGNAPEERKLLRLFRDSEVSQRIKRANDFGAGGVSVAIGELADGVEIHLDRVPLKYAGLEPREIAISESQERMAIVIDAKDLPLFEKKAQEENVQLTQVAEVIEEPVMRMLYGEEIIAEIERSFLDTAGCKREQSVTIGAGEKSHTLHKFNEYTLEDLEDRMTDLNLLSQKNLIEKFDSSVGRGTVLAPLGGERQLTPTQAMAALIPIEGKRAKTASVMSFGGDPAFIKENPFLGGYYAVVESITKLVATGADYRDIYLTFQEYFEKLGEDEERWAKPVEALLGAYRATMDLETPPIGGKDSMSGTFKNIDVPPTLVSFAVAPMPADQVISDVLQEPGNLLGVMRVKRNPLLDAEEFTHNARIIQEEIEKGNIQSATAITQKGTLPHLIESALGNGLGFTVEIEDLYNPLYGDILVEYREDFRDVSPIGVVTERDFIVNGRELDFNPIFTKWREGLDSVFSPEKHITDDRDIKVKEKEDRAKTCKKPVDVPKVTIVAFPGTNSEYDTAEAFAFAGAKSKIYVFKNQTTEENFASIQELADEIRNSQIFVIPGGFSFGDEPDGSAKFIANILRTEEIQSAIAYLLEENDGLVLGICNGFQALIKSGYLPEGTPRAQEKDSPTLTFNDNQRHVARIVNTKNITTDSPWLSHVELGKTYKVPISHGEGRFVIDEKKAKKLYENNQIAFLYEDNPNGSDYNIEGILSPDGKILGKMGHVERYEENLFKNIPNMEIIPIIQSGVDFMKGK